MSTAPAGQREAGAAGAGGVPGPPPRQDWRRADTYVPVIAAAAVMTGLGVWGLARDGSMGNDEVATRWAALLPLHLLVRLLRHLDAVHGLYYLVMHAWVAVGSTPTVIRVPSVMATVAAVALTVILARRLTGSGWAGLFAGLVMALTPAISYYAQTARSYAWVLACVAAATLALVHALAAEAPDGGGDSRRAVRRWVLYGALITLASYLNEMALLALAAHAVTVWLARYGRRAVTHWAAAAAVSVLLLIPLLLVSEAQSGAVGWIARPRVSDLRILFQDYFGVSYAVALVLLACAVAAALPARGRRGVSLPSVGLPLLVIPASLLLLESLVAKPLYVDRYVLYGEIGAALLAGAGIHRIGTWLARTTAANRPLVWLPGVVVCVLALVLQLGPQQRVRTPQSRLYDFGGPARYVGAHARAGDGVLFLTSFFRKDELGYPADFTRTDDFALAESPAQAGTFHGVDKPFAEVQPLMLAHRRIWVIGRLPSAPVLTGLPRAEGGVLENSFSMVAERHFRDIIVTLWVRR